MNIEDAEQILEIATAGSSGVDITPLNWGMGWDAIAYLADCPGPQQFRVNILAPEIEDCPSTVLQAIMSVDEICGAVDRGLGAREWRSPPPAFVLRPDAAHQLSEIAWAYRLSAAALRIVLADINGMPTSSQETLRPSARLLVKAA
jgi:hypothetical protein